MSNMDVVTGIKIVASAVGKDEHDYVAGDSEQLRIYIFITLLKLDSWSSQIDTTNEDR